jgi:glycogen phosphorylase
MDRILNFEDYLKIQRNHIENDLKQVYENLYHTWDNEQGDFVDELSGYNWRKSPFPSTIVETYLETKHVAEQDNEIKKIQSLLNNTQNYLDSSTWFSENYKGRSLERLESNPIVFFSAEFGLVDWMQVYSGGLGVLAGDVMKQMSDFGVPLTGVGLFYNFGYFHQDIDGEGKQKEEYIPQNPSSMFLKLIKDENRNPIESEVWIDDHIVFVRGWMVNVGRIKLVLLDTNFDKNLKWEDRMITGHLYGGTKDTRLRQEIVLGIGGYRFIQRMKIQPSVVHLNEGHAGFVHIAKLYENFDKSVDLATNLANNSKNVLFTNHTLNPAGNDKFNFNLFERYLSKYAKELGIGMEELFQIGTEPNYSPDNFSMTILGIKGARYVNAVSKLHGKRANEIWSNTNFKSVTNGVHLPTWVGPRISALFKKYVHKEWFDPKSKVDWELIDSIPDKELWNAHMEQKTEMINTINKTLGVNLDPNLPTVVWTRRFASYKRPNIFISDMIRLSKLVLHPKLKVQFLIGGKAHPQDEIGKNLLSEVIKITNYEEFKDKVVFLTGYNWKLAKKLVAGSDIWLNNPIRFEEASGTSGMKAGANGVLQLTTLDGWTDEVDWLHKGWILPEAQIHSQIYDILEHQIAPVYYNQNVQGNWTKMMKNMMKEIMNNFGTDRMMKDYLKLYEELISQ